MCLRKKNYKSLFLLINSVLLWSKFQTNLHYYQVQGNDFALANVETHIQIRIINQRFFFFFDTSGIRIYLMVHNRKKEKENKVLVVQTWAWDKKSYTYFYYTNIPCVSSSTDYHLNKPCTQLCTQAIYAFPYVLMGQINDGVDQVH